MTRWVLSLAAAAVLATPAAARAQAGGVTFSAFADAFYAFDFGKPEGHNRAFTTQAARHDEFDVNLAFVEARYTSPSVRGRVALQTGTSVQFNYGGEPDDMAGQPSYLPVIQEATVGVAVAPTLWVDAGLFFSHIGSESWISSDNPTYTRSLPAEFSPYYESGVRATWQAASALSAQLNVVNGWQNISENNEDKAAGVRLDWTVSPKVTLSYSNFVGREAHATEGDQGMRVLHDFIARLAPTDRTLVIGTFDLGTQEGDGWYAASLVGRAQASDRVAVSARYDRFNDPDGVIAIGLVTHGGSVGLDVTPAPNFFWRSELRSYFGAEGAIFPNRDASGGLSTSSTALVTSLAVRF